MSTRPCQHAESKIAGVDPYAADYDTFAPFQRRCLSCGAERHYQRQATGAVAVKTWITRDWDGTAYKLGERWAHAD